MISALCIQSVIILDKLSVLNNVQLSAQFYCRTELHTFQFQYVETMLYICH